MLPRFVWKKTNKVSRCQRILDVEAFLAVNTAPVAFTRQFMHEIFSFLGFTEAGNVTMEYHCGLSASLWMEFGSSQASKP